LPTFRWLRPLLKLFLPPRRRRRCGSFLNLLAVGGAAATVASLTFSLAALRLMARRSWDWRLLLLPLPLLPLLMLLPPLSTPPERPLLLARPMLPMPPLCVMSCVMLAASTEFVALSLAG